VTSIEKNGNCLKIALYPDRFRDYYRPGFLLSTGLISRSGHQFIDPATQVLLLDCVSCQGDCPPIFLQSFVLAVHSPQYVRARSVVFSHLSLYEMLQSSTLHLCKKDWKSRRVPAMR